MALCGICDAPADAEYPDGGEGAIPLCYLCSHLLHDHDLAPGRVRWYVVVHRTACACLPERIYPVVFAARHRRGRPRRGFQVLRQREEIYWRARASVQREASQRVRVPLN